jgi:hypothetical protein
MFPVSGEVALSLAPIDPAMVSFAETIVTLSEERDPAGVTVSCPKTGVSVGAGVVSVRFNNSTGLFRCYNLDA